jgi:hypothetical protein
LGFVSDDQLAKKLAVSASVVSARRHSLGIPASQKSVMRKPWAKQEIEMLGKYPDSHVVTVTGRGRRHVRSKRESLQIAPFQQHVQLDWTPRLLKRPGTVTDAELATELGVAVATVRLKRSQQSIPSHRKRSAGSKKR